MSLDYLFTILDEETFGFRIEKFQERDCPAVYHVWYIDPSDMVWRATQASTIQVALANASQQLCHTVPNPTLPDPTSPVPTKPLH